MGCKRNIVNDLMCDKLVRAVRFRAPLWQIRTLKRSPRTRTGLFAFNSRVVGKQELIIDPAQEWWVRTPSIRFFPAIPARNNRSFDWFLIGEKENRERSPAENPPPQNTIVRN
jgi:hypothetical protein